jgi:c-di-GMP-related signal transduction protein
MRDPYTTGNGNKGWIEAHRELSVPSLDPNGYDFVARQAIFNQMGEIYGYELLFRPGSQNHCNGTSDAATRTMVGNSMLRGFDGLTSSFPSFVNCTREALVGRWISLLPRTTTVLELVETVRADEDVVSACRSLKEMGYAIALDDFEFSRKMEPLVELADYVKIDFRVPEKQRRKTLRELKSTQATLVAEKIETEEELRIAFDEGFQLFQGFFLEAPRVFAKRKSADASPQARLLKAMNAFLPEAQEHDDTAGEARCLRQEIA